MSNTNIAELLIAASIVALPARAFSEDAKQIEREEMYQKYLEFPSYVKGGRVEPHWMANGNSFWYAEGEPDNRVIWKVDPLANTKTTLFEITEVRSNLANLLGHPPPGKGLPFKRFRFDNEKENVVKFSIEERNFVLELDTNRIKPDLSEGIDDSISQVASTLTTSPDGFRINEISSPTGEQLVGFKNHNLYVRSGKGSDIVELTDDGIEGFGWTPEFWPPPWAVWSPDGSKIATAKTDTRAATKIPIVHWLKREAEINVAYHPFSWIEDSPIVERQLYIFDIGARRFVPVRPPAEPNKLVQFIAWRPDSSEFLFWEYDRHFKTLAVKAADATTGVASLILAEESKTYHGNAVRWYGNPRYPMFTQLDDSSFIWMSERDGWNHLYLYDLNGVSTQLTEGEFPVEKIVTIDKVGRWVYFLAYVDRQRPYDLHLCRVNLDSRKSEQLTHAPGQHDISENWLSPSKKFFLDIHSSLNDPPVTELLRTDGTHLMTLSRADTEKEKTLRRQKPEEFVVNGSDNKTLIYGVLYKPFDFDPTKKYPVIDVISRPVPTRYDGGWSGVEAQALAQLGFITFIIEPRGAAGSRGRNKNFYEVRYGNVGRYEIDDHVAVLQRLARDRPYMDLSRVGVQGGSYNGYLALRAILSKPKDFHVAVVVAAFTDLAEHGSSIFLGPIAENKDAYEFASNRRLAANLEGKLLLVHGTADTAVPVSHTMKMVDAFVNAGKHFDMLILPDWGHWTNRRIESYWTEAKRRYFQEHLKP